jgi:hypothetical protein
VTGMAVYSQEEMKLKQINLINWVTFSFDKRVVMELFDHVSYTFTKIFMMRHALRECSKNRTKIVWNLGDKHFTHIISR